MLVVLRYLPEAVVWNMTECLYNLFLYVPTVIFYLAPEMQQCFYHSVIVFISVCKLSQFQIKWENGKVNSFQLII